MTIYYIFPYYFIQGLHWFSPSPRACLATSVERLVFLWSRDSLAPEGRVTRGFSSHDGKKGWTENFTWSMGVCLTWFETCFPLRVGKSNSFSWKMGLPNVPLVSWSCSPYVHGTWFFLIFWICAQNHPAQRSLMIFFSFYHSYSYPSFSPPHFLSFKSTFCTIQIVWSVLNRYKVHSIAVWITTYKNLTIWKKMLCMDCVQLNTAGSCWNRAYIYIHTHIYIFIFFCVSFLLF